MYGPYKVVHNGLLFKLKQNGIFRDLFKILSDFLKDGKQNVVLDSHVSL